MIEKVNPSHPDKIADRIAGAIVDIAYSQEQDPKIAVEVLIGHGYCRVMSETSTTIEPQKVFDTVDRIVGYHIGTDYLQAKQDVHLADNQNKGFKCGDNGIFKGMPLTSEQRLLSRIARDIYKSYPSDGKYILDGSKLIICQSNANSEDLARSYPNTTWQQTIINPLGEWTGGINVDTGATNRKLGSDMADSVTGGGLHGKDLSKADVSVNIYAFVKAQETGMPVELSCAIGDATVDGVPYSEIVEIAREYIKQRGGFEKFAEWGLF